MKEYRRLGHQDRNHVKAGHTVEDRHRHLLLPFRPAEVAPSTPASAGVGQRLGSIQVMPLRVQPQAGPSDRRNLDPLGHQHVHPADLVDHPLEGRKVEHNVVLDRDPDHALDRAHRQPGSAARKPIGFAGTVGGVDAVVLKSRDLDPQVTRNREHPDLLGDRVDRNQHHRVGARRADPGLPIAVVQAHQQDRDPRVTIPRGWRDLRERQSRRRNSWGKRDTVGRCAGNRRERVEAGAGPGGGQVAYNGVDQNGDQHKGQREATREAD